MTDDLDVAGTLSKIGSMLTHARQVNPSTQEEKQLRYFTNEEIPLKGASSRNTKVSAKQLLGFTRLHNCGRKHAVLLCRMLTSAIRTLTQSRQIEIQQLAFTLMNACLDSSFFVETFFEKHALNRHASRQGLMLSSTDEYKIASIAFRWDHFFHHKKRIWRLNQTIVVPLNDQHTMFVIRSRKGGYINNRYGNSGNEGFGTFCRFLCYQQRL